MVKNLYYVRKFSTDQTEVDRNVNKIDTTVKDMKYSLWNWFVRNEEYLSGALTLIVPSDYRDDVRIGQKISLEGLDGYFYAEGVNHNWRYQGPLLNTVSVTRGYSRVGKIKLTNRIFRKGKVALK